MWYVQSATQSYALSGQGVVQGQSCHCFASISIFWYFPAPLWLIIWLIISMTKVALRVWVWVKIAVAVASIVVMQLINLWKMKTWKPGGKNKQLCPAMQSSDEVRRRAPFPLFLGPPVGFSSNCSFFCTPFYFLAAIRKLHRKKLKCGLLSRLELSGQ